MKRLRVLDSEDKLIQFLLGFNNDFDNAINSVLAMDPLPSLSRVFYLVQQLEKQKEVSSLNSTPGSHEISASAVQKHQSHSYYNKDKYKRDWRKDKHDRLCDSVRRQHTQRMFVSKSRDFLTGLPRNFVVNLLRTCCC